MVKKRVQSIEQFSPAQNVLAQNTPTQNIPAQHRSVQNTLTSRARYRALLCLALVGSLLGLSLVIGKMAINSGAAPLSFLVVALLGSGTVLLIGERIKGQAFVINGRIVEYGLLAGALFALPNAIGFIAVEHVGAGFLSLTFAFPILITYILSLVVKLDRFSAGKSFAVLLGLSGGVILAFSKISSGDSALFWVAISMMSPIIIALGNIYRTLRWPAGISSMYLAAIMLLCAGFILLPVILFWGVGEFQQLFVQPEILVLLAFQTGLFTVMYLFYFVLQRLAGPVYLSQIGLVGAVVGTLAAVSLLGENVPQNLLIAAILVGMGTALFHFSSRR
ncbi:MAG: DMT family transporter [Rhizobiaceae bacterium]|nr:DMT family transporter [Rhizobiaceae bacterium]